MKLVVLLVVLIVAFMANCRDIPDRQPIQAPFIEEKDLPPVVVDLDFAEEEQYFKNGPKDVKEEMGVELRGKKDKKILKELVNKLDSLDYKMSQELKSIREKQNNITEGDLQIRMDLKEIRDTQINITDTNSIILSKLDNNCSSNKECPSGSFKISSHCFKYFWEKEVNWAEAKEMCKSHGLQLARATDSIAIPLRKYLVENYGGDSAAWMDAQGDGKNIRRKNDGTVISSSNSLWYTGRPGSMVTSSYCLRLVIGESAMNSQPNQPYLVMGCTSGNHGLCEKV